MATPFDGLAGKKLSITIEGKEVFIKPSVGDMEPFFVADNIDSKKKLGLSYISMVMRAYPEAVREDVEAFVVGNIGEFMEEVPIAVKVISRKELDDMKKRLKDKQMKESGNTPL